jgi:hypothetical protein
MARGMGAKKQLPVCHLCGREFGTHSIQIHIKACAVKYEREKGKPAPPAPNMLNEVTAGDRPISAVDWEKYNEQANATAEGNMERCPDCGRTFASKERLSVHFRSCTGEKKILRAGEKSSRSGTSQPAAAKPSLLKRMSTGSLLRKGQDAGDKAGEAGGEDPAPRRPSLLKRISSSSLLRSSKPAGGEGSARGGRGGGSASADGAGGGTGSARGASTAAKEQTAGDSARPGGGGKGSAKVPGYPLFERRVPRAPPFGLVNRCPSLTHARAAWIPALPRALPLALCPLPLASFGLGLWPLHRSASASSRSSSTRS